MRMLVTRLVLSSEYFSGFDCFVRLAGLERVCECELQTGRQENGAFAFLGRDLRVYASKTDM